jgi:hypothetical protein
MPQVVECPLCKHEARSSNPSSTKKKTKLKIKKKEKETHMDWGHGSSSRTLG